MFFFLQDGRTALHHAIMEQELIIAQHLVDFGCDVNIKDDVSIKLSIYMSDLISILCE